MYDENVKKIWEKAREAIQFRRQLKDLQWQELDAFDRGEQWTIKGEMPSWIPRPSTNFINKVKKFKTGNLMIDDYLGELKPLAVEDQPRIWMLQRFYEQLWDKLNLKYHILDVVRTSRLLGTGILYVGWNENYIGGTHGHLYQGEILIKPIEPSTFFVDPMAFDLEEANYCGTYIRTTEEAIMRDPSIDKKAKKDFKERRRVAASSQMSQQDRGEIYYNRDYSTYQQDVVDLITFYEKVETDDEVGFSIKVTYLADGIVIKEVEEIKPNNFPFIVLHQYKQRQDFWGISDCQLILPNVKMINKVQSVIGTLATLYQNPQKIVYEGSGIDPRIVSKYGNAFGLVFLSKHPDLANVIRNVEIEDIPRTLLEYIEFLKNDIEDFTGMTDINQGRRSGSIQTRGGMDTMLERSLTADQDEFALFEQFIEKVSYAVLLNAMEYYTDNRVMRMRNENPNSSFEYEYVPFKAEEFRDLMFDFSIDLIQKMKNTEETKLEVMQMLSEWQLQYSPDIQIVTPEDIVKAFNPSNRDEMIARIKQEEEIKSQETTQQIYQLVSEGIQQGADPNEIMQFIYQTINPQAQEVGDVQKRQQGLPARGGM